MKEPENGRHIDSLRKQRAAMLEKLQSIEAGNTKVSERGGSPHEWKDVTSDYEAALKSWVEWFDKHIAHHEEDLGR